MEAIPSSGSAGSSAEPTLKTCFGSNNLRALWGLFILNTSFAAIQLVAAIMANSLSMVSDSGSMMVDSIAYMLNIVLERRKHLLGAKAVKLWEVVISILSVGLLTIVTLFSLVDASSRLHRHDDGDDVDGRIVFGFAVGNFALDIAMCSNYFFHLRHRKRMQSVQDQIRHEAKNELNMVSAFVHLLADTLRTITSMIAGILEDTMKDKAISIDSIATFVVCGAIFLAASFVFYEAAQQLREYRALDEVTVIDADIPYEELHNQDTIA